MTRAGAALIAVASLAVATVTRVVRRRRAIGKLDPIEQRLERETAALRRVAEAVRRDPNVQAGVLLERDQRRRLRVEVVLYEGREPGTTCRRLPIARWHPLLEREAKVDAARIDAAVQAMRRTALGLAPVR